MVVSGAKILAVSPPGAGLVSDLIGPSRVVAAGDFGYPGAPPVSARCSISVALDQDCETGAVDERAGDMAPAIHPAAGSRQANAMTRPRPAAPNRYRTQRAAISRL